MLTKDILAFVKINLSKQTMAPKNMATQKLEISEINEHLKALPNWVLSNDNSFLTCQFKFKNWLEVMAFLQQVSTLAEKLNHHPNVNFTYGFCEIKIQTHSVKGITNLDFSLASEIAKLQLN